MQAYRWIADLRDQFTKERLAGVNDTMTLYLDHGRQVRMHSARMLHDFVPVVLVKLRVVRGVNGVDASLPLDRKLP